MNMPVFQFQCSYSCSVLSWNIRTSRLCIEDMLLSTSLLE